MVTSQILTQFSKRAIWPILSLNISILLNIFTPSPHFTDRCLRPRSLVILSRTMPQSYNGLRLTGEV